MSAHNNRVLLIDDTSAIHEDFRKILCPPPAPYGLAEAEAVLFGTPAAADTARFELDCTSQGQEGLAAVEAALLTGKPYALAFVDMIMPPGWSGMETIERLWQADPCLQVVICTAHSELPWDEVLARLDVRDRLLIIKKPLDMIEVSQLARTLTAKWVLAQRAASQLDCMQESLKDLKATEAALRQSNRELELFSSAVAHDLRSPLRSIDGFSHLLQRAVDGDTAASAVHYLNRIRAGVKQMSELTEGLLSLAHVSSAQLEAETVDITEMAGEVVASLRARDAARPVQVHVQQHLEATGHPALLRQVLENLLANAWKFSAHAAAPEIRVGKVHTDCETSVYFVQDNGAGFDMAQADQLFMPFHRLHSPAEFPGAGIGLATTRRIIDRHAGQIWAEGAVGEGATFYFTLPSTQPGGMTPENLLN